MEDKQVEQHLQKNTAAMYAIAEQLQKQEDRWTAQDAEVALQKQAKELEVAKAQNAIDAQELVKQITDGVLADLAKSTIYGQKENMELNGDEEKSVSHKDVFYSEGGDEDSQVDAKDENKTEEVQQTLHAGGAKSLQLMKAEIVSELKKHFLKEHEAQYAGGDDSAVAEEIMEEPAEEAMDMDTGMEDPEGSSEYPMEEEEYDQDTFKMVKDLQKELKAQIASIPSMVLKQAQDLSESQLLKSGFRKESTKQPQITRSMGLDDADYAIQKSQETTEDFDINKVSFGDLYTAKMKRDSEGTDGLPANFFRA